MIHIIKFQKIKVDIYKYLGDISEVIKNYDQVVVVYLFGSYAREDIGPLSDIDIAVLLNGEVEDTKDVRFRLFRNLTLTLHTDEIDLIILNEAPIVIKYNILRTGKVLYCRNDLERIRFQVAVVNEYLDSKYIRDRYRKELFKRIKDGAPSGRYRIYNRTFGNLRRISR